MTAHRPTLVPRRDASGGDLVTAEQLEVRDHDALLALPAGVLPVLRGDAAFAVGAGALVLARDDVRVCGVEGAAVRAGDRAVVEVWEGAAVAADGAVRVTVGAGGRAWVASDSARVTCRPGPAGLPVEEQEADLEAVVQGRSTVLVEGGRVRVTAGATVTASGSATVAVDSSVRTDVLEGRAVRLHDEPAGPPLDLDAELRRHLAERSRPAVRADRQVLLPWPTPGAAPEELLAPLLEALEATGARQLGGWERGAGPRSVDVRGPVDWPAVLALLALPSSVALRRQADGQRVVTDLDAQIRVREGGLLSRLRGV